MKKIEKRHLVLGTLVIALSAAVYLNWQFGVSDNVSKTSKELGVAKFVNATTSTEETSTFDEAMQTSNMTSEQQQYLSICVYEKTKGVTNGKQRRKRNL